TRGGVFDKIVFAFGVPQFKIPIVNLQATCQQKSRFYPVDAHLARSELNSRSGRDRITTQTAQCNINVFVVQNKQAVSELYGFLGDTRISMHDDLRVEGEGRVCVKTLVHDNSTQ